jgi:hypothetical protein
MIYMYRSRFVAFVVALLATLAVLPAPAHAAAATGGVIEGTLTTADSSAPVAGARLQIKAYSGTPSYLLPEAVTDESGHYRLEPLPAGRYRIGFYFAETGDQLWAPHKTRETAATWYTVTDGGTTVVNDSLFPTGDLDVTFKNADGPITAFCADASGDYFLRSGCTSTGTLNLTGLRSGRYVVLVWVEGETAVSPAWATITTGALTAVTVTKR